VRVKELDTVAKRVLKFDSVSVGDFTDSPDEFWNATLISEAITSRLDQLSLVSNEELVAVVSFDVKGISGHANHVSTCWGVEHFALRAPPTISCFQLVSDPVWLKYTSVFGALLAKTRRNRVNEVALFNPDPFTLPYIAMSTHASQFVWFRRLFVLLARCTMVNTLIKI
jgi:N-acetylglucosaminylphosphatidylinositol deacetylase